MTMAKPKPLPYGALVPVAAYPEYLKPLLGRFKGIFLGSCIDKGNQSMRWRAHCHGGGELDGMICLPSRAMLTKPKYKRVVLHEVAHAIVALEKLATDAELQAGGHCAVWVKVLMTIGRKRLTMLEKSAVDREAAMLRRGAEKRAA